MSTLSIYPPIFSTSTNLKIYKLLDTKNQVIFFKSINYLHVKFLLAGAKDTKSLISIQPSCLLWNLQKGIMYSKLSVPKHFFI